MSFVSGGYCSRSESEESIVHKHNRWKGIIGRRLDIVIFGATGCAGRFTVLEAVKVLRSYSWGIAGRNKQKMEQLLQEIGIRSRKNLSQIPVIPANLKHKRSLYSLAKKCRVLINCCGPYETYGENVIKACIFAKTHYVDLCTESHFIDTIHYKFDELSKRKGVYVVMGCGLQSLPAEIGINYMKHNFKGTINSIDAYVEFWTKNPWVLGSIANNNVWASFILANRNMRRYRRRLLPQMYPKAPRTNILSESDVILGFCVPAPTVDQDIVDRSQQYFWEEKNERPIQYNNYFTFSNPAIAFLLLCWYFFILILTQFACTRRLLLKCPRLFSFGLFSSNGPMEDNVDETFFRITFKAKGWDKSMKSIQHIFPENPDKVVVGRASGACPFYGIACVCLLVSAVTIYNEHSKFPHRGGVYTPGAAFAHTKIINELKKYEHGLFFEIISTN
ncbi:saccharopine dehydrogenase-like oxidoreductase isoform X2 [Zeugodacus cucurbitae]|uniref:Saccharopine dehydrogenase-like oxidoreductase n=1 Tax=Zeugodacus cucurbitae TaxID=28588 RepID=A0A0A1XFM1_ZEUCU|nr:saccharopine dehydrogenase-like oxidoreductase isoform X2 [Zeugodacus cucurbitae]